EFTDSFSQEVESAWQVGHSRFALADLLLAPGNIGFQLLANRSIHGGLLVFLQRLLPQLRRACRCIERARFLPRLIVLPVGQDRLVEGSGIALQRMRLAEEMPSRWHL